MPEFISFGSFDEMWKFLEESRAIADSQVQEWQKAIRPGRYFLSIEPSLGLVIYNEVIEPDPEETELAEHSRLVKAYSVIVPEGELGLVHVSRAEYNLTRPQFETAKKLGWPSDLQVIQIILTFRF